MSLLYRGTRDGFTHHNWIAKVKGYRGTLGLVKKDGNFIYGFYTNLEWGPGSRTGDGKAFWIVIEGSNI